MTGYAFTNFTRRKTLPILACAGITLVLAGLAAHARKPASPAIVLWAWERPEDLRFLNSETGVAFLAKTIVLERSAIAVRPRRQPLEIPPDSPRIAVARIENGQAPGLTPGQRDAAVAELAALAEIPRLSAVQIDYDALASQRAFYAGLLRDLRGRLPAHIKLSVTALASWCTSGDWISGLPVDEAVPMLFRLGPDAAAILRNPDFRPKTCRESLGISTDEPIRTLPSGRRIYIFNPRPWTAETASTAIQKAKAWQ